MSGHTPGPWEWYTSNSYNRLGAAYGPYCELLYPVVYKDGHPGIEWRNEADARLIAAAPELLEALRALAGTEAAQRHLVSSGASTVNTVRFVRAVIAKAEGGK